MDRTQLQFRKLTSTFRHPPLALSLASSPGDAWQASCTLDDTKQKYGRRTDQVILITTNHRHSSLTGEAAMRLDGRTLACVEMQTTNLRRVLLLYTPALLGGSWRLPFKIRNTKTANTPHQIHEWPSEWPSEPWTDCSAAAPLPLRRLCPRKAGCRTDLAIACMMVPMPAPPCRDRRVGSG